MAGMKVMGTKDKMNKVIKEKEMKMKEKIVIINITVTTTVK